MVLARAGLLVLVSILTLGLTACGEQLIKPADKHLEAMIEFEMPDYDSTPANAVKKVENWLQATLEKETGSTQYVSTQDDLVNGRGLITVQSRSDDLIVSFQVEVTVLKPTLIKFRTYGYQDEPGPRQGDSDKAYVFYNLVKDKVLEMSDELESYMDSNTKTDSLLDL